MVISNNPNITHKDFESLLDLTTAKLHTGALEYEDKYLKLLGNKLENEVFYLMDCCATGTVFENTIELVSGQKFPDIIANNYYGVEVKSTKQNHWKSAGNSVLESTRISEIERIYMLFGKMCSPIEFKYRLYEECLSEVIVTHSPRYSIDMNLEQGATIFDKIEMGYDRIRQYQNPIKPFKEYYRNKLSEGQELWWMDNIEYTPDSIIIKVWNTIDKEEKELYKIKGFTLFPEILSNKQTKFDRFSLWLSSENRILCPNVRDLYTAGGRQEVYVDGTRFVGVPNVISRFFKYFNGIRAQFEITEVEDFEKVWRKKNLNKPQIKKLWIDEICRYMLKKYDFGSLNIQAWLEDRIKG